MSTHATADGLPADMPPEVRRIVYLLAIKYELAPASVFDSILGMFAKSQSGNPCAGCGETIHGEPAGLYVIDEAPRAAVGSVCQCCVERYQTDAEFARKLDSEGYRAAHGAGPDDVAGHA